MNFQQIELMFSRAWSHAFQLKKCLFLFLFLLFCSIFAVMCHTVGALCGIWIKLMMVFLPGFLLSGVLLALGVFYARVYYHEMRGQTTTYREIFFSSLRRLVHVTQIALPLVLTYVVIWMVMGLFYLVREIPYVGESIGLILSFAPFILILSSLLLSLGCAFALFFITPHIAFKQEESEQFVTTLTKSFGTHLFSHLLLFVIAFSPCLLMILLLSISGSVAQIGLIEGYSVLKSSLQWFFMSLPFAAAMTPIFLFFFNFSVESYNLMRKLSRA